MEINEYKEKKKELQDKISELIHDFEKESGVDICKIEFQSFSDFKLDNTGTIKTWLISITSNI